MAEEQKTRSKRKHRQGRVLRDKMDKGLIVWVERKLRHQRYEKVIKIGKKYYVHDENNEAQIGDIVDIVETRPVSKLKRWRLAGIVRKAKKPDKKQVKGAEE